MESLARIASDFGGLSINATGLPPWVQRLVCERYFHDILNSFEKAARARAQKSSQPRGKQQADFIADSPRARGVRRRAER